MYDYQIYRNPGFFHNNGDPEQGIHPSNPVVWRNWIEFDKTWGYGADFWFFPNANSPSYYGVNWPWAFYWWQLLYNSSESYAWTVWVRDYVVLDVTPSTVYTVTQSSVYNHPTLSTAQETGSFTNFTDNNDTTCAGQIPILFQILNCFNP